jgi:REP element-mobilizing transposase RayT
MVAKDVYRIYNLFMARQERKSSSTGVHHVMIRGVNRQNIFEDEADHKQFRKILFSYKRVSGFKLFAYCLMGNHAHLLLKIGEEPLGSVMKRIEVSYVSWYNRKYERSGHLFQDRFKSEPIEQENHLLSAVRYIHQNPMKAGLCDKAEKYAWSSYLAYIGGNTHRDETDIEEILWMFSTDTTKQIVLFSKFTHEQGAGNFLEVDAGIRLTERECREVLKAICGVENVSQFQSMQTDRRDKSIRLAKERGLSIRQISRLTGISYGIVRSK